MTTNSDDNKQRVLDAGIRLWPRISARAIGRELGMSHTNILYHFGTADELRDAVAAEAVRVGNSKVIAQLIIEKDKAVANMNEFDRQHHVKIASAAW